MSAIDTKQSFTAVLMFHRATVQYSPILRTHKKRNNLRWSGRPRTGFIYPSRAILTSALKILCLIFVVVGHRRNIFNDENFPIYGSCCTLCTTNISSILAVNTLHTVNTAYLLER